MVGTKRGEHIVNIKNFFLLYVISLLGLLFFFLSFSPMIEWRSYIDWFISTPFWVVVGQSGFFLLAGLGITVVLTLTYELATW